MYALTLLMCYFFAAISSFDHVQAKSKPSNSVLLTSVKTLTLRKDKMTTSRRVSAIPQLQCIGGSGNGLYEVDIMRCTNQGSDYDPNNVQWTCTASLPPEFKLGSTDVVCEGYDSPEDPYILKGSCGVEYRLVLTEAGEAKYSSRNRPVSSKPTQSTQSTSKRESLANFLFMCIFVVVLAYIVIEFLRSYFAQDRNRRPPRWGTGGSGGPGDDDDQPPPYDPRPPPKPKNWTPQASSSRSGSSRSGQGWNPGFWAGAAGGAAAGYMAGRASQSSQQAARRREAAEMEAELDRHEERMMQEEWARSRWNPSHASSSTPSYSSTRYESTGFGETRRR